MIVPALYFPRVPIYLLTAEDINMSSNNSWWSVWPLHGHEWAAIEIGFHIPRSPVAKFPSPDMYSRRQHYYGGRMDIRAIICMHWQPNELWWESQADNRGRAHPWRCRRILSNGTMCISCVIVVASVAVAVAVVDSVVVAVVVVVASDLYQDQRYIFPHSIISSLSSVLVIVAMHARRYDRLYSIAQTRSPIVATNNGPQSFPLLFSINQKEHSRDPEDTKDDDDAEEALYTMSTPSSFPPGCR